MPGRALPRCRVPHPCTGSASMRPAPSFSRGVSETGGAEALYWVRDRLPQCWGSASRGVRHRQRDRSGHRRTQHATPHGSWSRAAVSATPTGNSIARIRTVTAPRRTYSTRLSKTPFLFGARVKRVDRHGIPDTCGNDAFGPGDGTHIYWMVLLVCRFDGLQSQPVEDGILFEAAPQDYQDFYGIPQKSASR